MQEKYIDKAVQSVMEQNYTNWELLLIENGSGGCEFGQMQKKC